MRALIDRTTEVVARKIRATRHVDGITDIGTERGGDGAERIWQRVVALYASGMHPAIQVCVRHRGEVIIERALGHAQGVEPGKRPSPEARRLHVDTPINLFSAAKPVAAVVMHKLQQDGVLNLDDPVSEHVPDFARHGKDKITINQVINHTAGIPKLPAEALDVELLGDSEVIDEYIRDLKITGKHDGPPYYHAISGGFVLDAVARHATGKSLQQMLREDFKQKLGLQWFDFGVSAEESADVAHNLATGFRLGPVLKPLFGRLLGLPWDDAIRLSNDPRFLQGVIPSGNLISTASDVAAFYQCLLNGGELDGKRVLDSDTVANLIHAPEARVEIDRMIGLPLRFGNGFMMGSDWLSLYGWNHPRIFGHLGLSNILTWADPDRELVVAVLTTGKPVLGTHLLALPQLISEIHKVFPEV